MSMRPPGWYVTHSIDSLIGSMLRRLEKCFHKFGQFIDHQLLMTSAKTSVLYHR